jgi:hypothetical protein
MNLFTTSDCGQKAINGVVERPYYKVVNQAATAGVAASLHRRMQSNKDQWKRLQQRFQAQLPRGRSQDLGRIRAASRARLARMRSPPIFNAIDKDRSGYIEPPELSSAEDLLRRANLSPSRFGLENGVNAVSQQMFQSKITRMEDSMGSKFQGWIQQVETTLKVSKQMADGSVDEKHWQNKETKRI